LAWIKSDALGTEKKGIILTSSKGKEVCVIGFQVVNNRKKPWKELPLRKKELGALSLQKEELRGFSIKRIFGKGALLGPDAFRGEVEKAV